MIWLHVKDGDVLRRALEFEVQGERKNDRLKNK